MKNGIVKIYQCVQEISNPLFSPLNLRGNTRGLVSSIMKGGMRGIYGGMCVYRIKSGIRKDTAIMVPPMWWTRLRLASFITENYNFVKSNKRALFLQGSLRAVSGQEINSLSKLPNVYIVYRTKKILSSQFLVAPAGIRTQILLFVGELLFPVKLQGRRTYILKESHE